MLQYTHISHILQFNKQKSFGWSHKDQSEANNLLLSSLGHNLTTNQFCMGFKQGAQEVDF